MQFFFWTTLKHMECYRSHNMALYYKCKTDYINLQHTLQNILTKAPVMFFRSTVYALQQCEELGGHYSLADNSCYYNGSQDGNICRYFVNLKCYPFVDSFYTASTCAYIGGIFTTSDIKGEPGNFCYYKLFNCTFHSANNQCYRFKTVMNNQSECDANNGYYQYGYCYSECPVSKYLINETCYDYRRTYTPEKCTQLQGYFTGNFCYYGETCTSGHMINHRCYPFVDSDFTASTCANIGGYFATSNRQGQSGQFCYFTRFNCAFHALNGQCYRVKSAVARQTECDSNAGYYNDGYCYYECPDTKFLVNDECYDTRSAQYTQRDCRAVGGLYEHSYCYMKGCNYTMINNTCYKNKSPDYSNGTCINIGGYYRAEALYPYKAYCYYTGFNCRYHAVNGQCYSRSSNHSQAVCETITDSYYDVSSNTCYYYCTEIPELQQCFVDDNPSFSRGTCGNIGGTYYNGTCYYIASYCAMYDLNNGECYSNRSEAFTCDTCRNIGGRYADGFCYYHQYNCSAYSVDGQCYSSVHSGYSSSSCRNRGGLYRSPRCYNDASRCSTSYYRNCTCFSYRSSSQTADTCTNIGGYYDFKIRKCFYNSSTCLTPYYDTNSQCYRYRDASFSRESCSLIEGYYSYGADENGQYGYACYLQELFNCSMWVNDKCYLRFSASYNEGTCTSVRGYYSLDDTGCYYNTSSACNYWKEGQCYDTYYSGWSATDCEDVNGYFYSYYSRCYISNFYCPYLFNSYRKCYFHTSASYDCSSCRLVDGFEYSGTCYYSANCSKPLIVAGNGQCYANQTEVRTAAECSSMRGEAFYEDGMCYYTTSSCSGHEVNCQCYTHRSPIYTADSCINFGGHYTNNRCYYNSSHCRDGYHSINGQCYRQSAQYSPSTCHNIGGYYDYPSASHLSGTCYYNSFNCSGFIVDSRHCYTDRANYSSTTCTNIGGIYGYLYSGRHYRSAGSSIYSWRTYHCLYDTFDCAG